VADHFEQTVVQQIIPDTDMTPLERLLLSRIFDFERDGDGWYFFARQNPSTTIGVTRAELQNALASSPDTKSTAHLCVTGQLADVEDRASEIMLDLSDTWAFFLQDIVKRSRILHYVSVVAAFTCNKMRADGFGGMVMLITRDAIIGKSTTDLLEDLLNQAGLGCDGAQATEIVQAPPIQPPE
jgi:hypothetical protein